MVYAHWEIVDDSMDEIVGGSLQQEVGDSGAVNVVSAVKWVDCNHCIADDRFFDRVD